MKPYVESPIIVTGCPRSGTSIVSGMLEICGALWGPLLSQLKMIQEGWERIKVSMIR